MNITREKATGVYIATPCSNAFIEPKYRDSIIYTYASHASTTGPKLQISFISHSSKKWHNQTANSYPIAYMMFLAHASTCCPTISEVPATEMIVSW